MVYYYVLIVRIREVKMGFSYNKLWKILIDRGMNKTALRDGVGFTPTTLLDLCQYSRHIFSNKFYATLLKLSSHSWGVT